MSQPTGFTAPGTPALGKATEPVTLGSESEPKTFKIDTSSPTLTFTMDDWGARVDGTGMLKDATSRQLVVLEALCRFVADEAATLLRDRHGQG